MNKEAISVVLKFLKFYILLGAFFNHGICQGKNLNSLCSFYLNCTFGCPFLGYKFILYVDCELQYVMELPSNISCNPYLEMELKLKCVVQGMASIGRRVEMAWFHTSIDNITLDVTNISSLGRHFMHRAVTHGDKWNLTSYLNLTGIRYPAQAGKWFCQPTLDGNLVLPSNMLTIGEPEGNTTCNESLAHSTTRCAYFLSPSTTDPMLVNITDSQPQPQTISSFMLSLPSSPIPNPTTSSTKSVGLWVFALAIIVVVFAIIILVLAVLLVVFFLKRKSKFLWYLKTIQLRTLDLTQILHNIPCRSCTLLHTQQ